MAFFAFCERDTCLCPIFIYVGVARAHVKCSAVSMPVISGRRVERVEWLGTLWRHLWRQRAAASSRLRRSILWRRWLQGRVQWIASMQCPPLPRSEWLAAKALSLSLSPSAIFRMIFYFISERKAVALNKHLHSKIYRTVWTLSNKTWTNRKPEKGPKKMRPEMAVSLSFRIWIPLS